VAAWRSQGLTWRRMLADAGFRLEAEHPVA